MQIHSHIESELWLRAAEEHLLGSIRFEEDARNMANENVLFSFILDGLDRVNHTNVLALLESNLGQLKLNELEALFAEHFEELLGEAIGDSGDLDGFLILVTGQVLKEVTKVALVRVVLTSPLVQIRVSGQVLSSDSIGASVGVDIAILEDDWLHVLVNLSDNTRLLLVDLIKSEELR